LHAAWASGRGRGQRRGPADARALGGCSAPASPPPSTTTVCHTPRQARRTRCAPLRPRELRSASGSSSTSEGRLKLYCSPNRGSSTTPPPASATLALTCGAGPPAGQGASGSWARRQPPLTGNSWRGQGAEHAAASGIWLLRCGRAGGACACTDRARARLWSVAAWCVGACG
jgi:hypothetical protein